MAHTDGPDLPELPGGYQALAPLGRGAFGEVWRAQAPGGIEVAVKLISRTLQPGDADVELGALELIKGLRHQSLLSLQAFFALDSRLVIVLELADGSLRQRLNQCRQSGLPGLPPAELAGYLLEAAEALDFLHQHRVLHRDVKPDNLLRVGAHAKVGDCGLAKLLERISLQTASVAGTPAYIAPEVWLGKIGQQSDQYALAVAYAELRLGRLPFAAGNYAEAMYQHLQGKPNLAGLSEAEQAALSRALEKDPVARFPSCLALAQALAAASVRRAVVGAAAGEAGAGTEEDGTLRPPGEPPPHGATAEPVQGAANTLHGTTSTLPHAAANSPAAAHGQEGHHVGYPRTVAAALLVGALLGTLAVTVLPALLTSEAQEEGKLAGAAEGSPRPEPAGTVPPAPLPESRAPAITAPLPSPTPTTPNRKEPAIDKPPPPVPEPRPEPPPPKVPVPTPPEVVKPVVNPPPALLQAPFTESKAREAQQAWATFLRRKVEEEIDLGNGLKMPFLLIPPGTFLMGFPAEEGHEGEEEHEVTISRPFYLGCCEVTRGQFRHFVDSDGYRTEAERDGLGGGGYHDISGKFRGPSFDAITGKHAGGLKTPYNWKNVGFTQTDTHPVLNVSWHDAQAFCRWLAVQSGRAAQLPSEAEWEWACRAGSRSRYHFGNDADELARFANVVDGTARRRFPKWQGIAALDGYVFTAPVGSYAANAFGLCDTHGNAWEWCQDWYGPYTGLAARDPVRADRGAVNARVLRGGSWYEIASHCRAASRKGFPPAARDCTAGFRVALRLE